ncbi:MULTISPECIES: LytTR family DNA-binding domain-containing protein [unclassified Clostridium]|uniref:LytR/AlgR family response regulator transcription factor n=1 Tax=unclassified Clostridium TaxID=2614128 RepID=UPI00290E35DD|nr:LytTR family DNA-binding domain-containing protein [Clostridium sp.]MDU5108226.1 LytTR family DNA-binding domain-containing protein [Clostridium sp.]
MKVAIIDDEKPARSELIFLIKEIIPNVVISEFSNGEEVLEAISNESYDLFCIDINLGDISGTTLAKMVRKVLPCTEIVFATAYNNYADKAFEVEAMYYLLKPFSEAKVKQMLERYNNKKSENNKKNIEELFTKIPLYLDKKFIMIDIEDIIYIESENRECIVHTKNEIYKDSNTLNYFEERLADKGFFRIHKSFLINLKYISEIHPWFNNTYCIKVNRVKDAFLPVSRNKIKELKRILHLKH